jgi:hypothetical protein
MRPARPGADYREPAAHYDVLAEARNACHLKTGQPLTADGAVGHQSAAGHPAARGWELVSAAAVPSSVAAKTGRAAASAAFPAEASVADPELLASNT